MIPTSNTTFYNSKEQYDKEIDHLFMRSWILVCHSSEIPQPGSYLCVKIITEPIVILRNSNLVIQAFYNICTHRGYPLFTKKSDRMNKEVRCGYHGWTFDNNGKKIGDSCSRFQLQSIETCVKNGWVYIKIMPSPEILADKQPHLDMTSDDFTYAKPVRNTVFEKVIDVNWKFFIENTLEGGHVPHVHHGLNELIGNQYQFEVDGYNTKTTADIKPSSKKGWSENLYAKALNRDKALTQKWTFYFVFPNVQITVYPEQIFLLSAIPIDIRKTWIRGRFFSRTENSKNNDRLKYLNLRIGRKIFKEDLNVFEKIKQSLDCKTFSKLNTLEKEDESILHFHKSYDHFFSSRTCK